VNMESYGGAWPVMVTPFDEQLKIDRGAYREMVQWYLRRGAQGLYANCLSSEMYHLTEDERLQLAADAVETAGGQVPVAATGNFGQSFDEHQAACRRMAETGVDVVMLVIPEFLENDAQLERYFFEMAEKVSAPLGIYECPVPRSYHLGLELVEKLARSGRFTAYKETSCSWPKIQRLIAVTQRTPLAYLQANTPYLLEAVRAGAPGTMSIGSIWLPDLTAAVIAAGKAGSPSAEALHSHLCALEMAQRAIHPLGTKYLLQKRGVNIQPRLRSSRQELSEEVRASLDYCASLWFDQVGNLLPHILPSGSFSPGSTAR
jgi:4-hydroxy-tetrahydrodipicolinate synthase